MPAPSDNDDARERVRLVRSRTRPRALRVFVAGLCVAGLIVALAFALASRRGRAGPRANDRPPQLLVDERTCYFGWAPDMVDELSMPGKPLHWQVRTDEDGFRVGARPHPPHPRCRALVVGDSFTAGEWVKGDEAFPAVLEKLLDDQGYSVRVDNGGTVGQTIAQERTNLLSRWAGLHSDLAVVATCGNDLTDLALLQARSCRLETAPVSALRPFGSAADRALDGFTQEVRAQLVHTRSRMEEIVDSGGGALPESRAACDAAADEYVREAVDTARALRARHERLVFDLLEPFFCPAAHGAWGEPEQNAFSARLTTALKAEGAVVLVSPWAARLTPWDEHPSPAGHRTIARALAQRLESLGWLDRCRP